MQNPAPEEPHTGTTTNPDPIASIDWNGIWNALVAARRPHGTDPSGWNKKARGFSLRAGRSEYTERLLSLLAIGSDDTILDVGCGEGSVTIPIARLARSVTAMDYAKGMLEILEERCRLEGIRNVRTREASWYDDWVAAGIPEKSHDVILASRSFLVRDLAEAVDNLNRTARRRIHAVTVAGESSASAPLLRAIGRPEAPAPDYMIALNYLRSINIFAEVRFLLLRNSEYLAEPEEALEWMRLSIENPTAEEERMLRTYLEEHLVDVDGRALFRSDRSVRWAVLSWEPPA